VLDNGVLVVGSKCYAHMGLQKRTTLLSFLLALSLSVLSVFAGSPHSIATAQTALSGYTPQPQSPEEFRLPNCYSDTGAAVPVGSECGAPVIVAAACKSIHTLCEDVGGVPTCVARDKFDQKDQVCEIRGGCFAPSLCDDSGRCQSSGAVDCTGNTTGCETWGCAALPGGTCEKTETKPAVAAECLAVDNPNPVVCGQPYQRSFQPVKAAQCGGASCPAPQQLVAAPCAPNVTEAGGTCAYDFVDVLPADQGPAKCQAFCQVDGMWQGPNSANYHPRQYCLCTLLKGGFTCPTIQGKQSVGPNNNTAECPANAPLRFDCLLERMQNGDESPLTMRLNAGRSIKSKCQSIKRSPPQSASFTVPKTAFIPGTRFDSMSVCYP